MDTVAPTFKEPSQKAITHTVKSLVASENPSFPSCLIITLNINADQVRPYHFLFYTAPWSQSDYNIELAFSEIA